MSLTLAGFLVKHNAQKSCTLEVFTEYVSAPGHVYGGPVVTVRCLKDQDEFSHQLYNVADAKLEDAEIQPMKTGEIGRYVCVPASTCIFSPDITIRGHGVWVKGEHATSSAHRECFQVRQGNRRPVDMESYKRTAPAFNCITYPGRGMHYMWPGVGCQWCGRSAEEVRRMERNAV